MVRRDDSLCQDLSPYWKVCVWMKHFIHGRSNQETPTITIKYIQLYVTYPGT